MPNVQRSTFSFQRSTASIERWKLSVERWTLVLLIFVGGLSCHHAPPPEKTITVWYSWGNDLAKQLRMICDEFEKTHPGVRVQLSYSANDLTSNQKLFLAIAGGVGPDVTFVDGQQLSEWAARGAMEDSLPSQ